MCETQEVDQPEHHHPSNEGRLTDEENAGEDNGKEEAEYWHDHSELEIIHQYSPNWKVEYYCDNNHDGPGSHLRNLERQFVSPLNPPKRLISYKWFLINLGGDLQLIFNNLPCHYLSE